MAGGYIRHRQGDGGVGIDIILGTSPIDSPIRIFDANEVLLWQVNPIGNVSGGVTIQPVRTTTGTPVSVTSTDGVVLVDATAGNVTVNLLTATQAGSMTRAVRIMKIDSTAHTVTIVPSVGGQTIDGLANIVLHSQFEDVTLVSDGNTKWFTFPGSFANSGGSFVATSTTPYAVTFNDRIINADATGGAFAVNLPAANSVPAGWPVSIKKVDASGNAVTVNRAGADLIDGATTASLAAQFNSVNLRSDGVSAWWKF